MVEQDTIQNPEPTIEVEESDILLFPAFLFSRSVFYISLLFFPSIFDFRVSVCVLLVLYYN
jgi:hypothetical protein